MAFLLRRESFATPLFAPLSCCVDLHLRSFRRSTLWRGCVQRVGDVSVVPSKPPSVPLVAPWPLLVNAGSRKTPSRWREDGAAAPAPFQKHRRAVERRSPGKVPFQMTAVGADRDVGWSLRSSIPRRFEIRPRELTPRHRCPRHDTRIRRMLPRGQVCLCDKNQPGWLVQVFSG